MYNLTSNERRAYESVDEKSLKLYPERRRKNEFGP